MAPGRCAEQATTTIPIVMVYGIDPVGAGFIASLARPGGNVTGGITRRPFCHRCHPAPVEAQVALMR